VAQSSFYSEISGNEIIAPEIGDEIHEIAEIGDEIHEIAEISDEINEIAEIAENPAVEDIEELRESAGDEEGSNGKV
jgi:hypothetical protein